MTTFPFHDVDDARAEARELLAATRKRVGTLPNLFRGPAEATAALAQFTREPASAAR